MKIRTKEIGYREMSRIADFIRKIENRNVKFDGIIKDFDDVQISYDKNRDEVYVISYIDDMPMFAYYEDEF